MSNENSTLSHPLLEITQAKGTGKVPPNTLSNNIDGIMQAFNSISDQRRGQATLQKKQQVTRQRLKATEPAEPYNLVLTTMRNNNPSILLYQGGYIPKVTNAKSVIVSASLFGFHFYSKQLAVLLFQLRCLPLPVKHGPVMYPRFSQSVSESTGVKAFLLMICCVFPSDSSL